MDGMNRCGQVLPVQLYRNSSLAMGRFRTEPFLFFIMPIQLRSKNFAVASCSIAQTLWGVVLVIESTQNVSKAMAFVDALENYHCHLEPCTYQHSNLIIIGRVSKSRHTRQYRNSSYFPTVLTGVLHWPRLEQGSVVTISQEDGHAAQRP